MDSIKNQTFQDFKLLICDDCSTDNTISICKAWIKDNRPGFAVTILDSTINGGITKNLNKGLRVAKGEWIKILAGDDLLSNDSLELYTKFVDENKKVKVLCSKFKLFNNTFNKNFLFDPSLKGYSRFYAEETSAKSQLHMLYRRNFVHGPTFFAQRQLLEDIGGFDERFKFEDLSVGVAITKTNTKIYFMDAVTVYYRIHEKSITRSQTALFSKFYLEIYKFNKEVVFKEANMFIVVAKKYEYYRHFLLDQLGLNKNKPVSRVLYNLTRIINPFNIYNLYF